MKKKMLFVGSIVGLSMVFLLGCSQTNPVNSGEVESNSLEQLPPNNITPYQYPEAANYPPPGYQFIALLNPEERTTDDIWVSAYMTVQTGGVLNLNNSQLKMFPDGLPYNSWIMMGKESLTSPWLNFEPHGLVFNNPPRVIMSYAGCTLPPNVLPQDLVIWYWNEELNEYEYIGGENNLQSQKITFYLNHFSRYVVASRLTTF